MENIFNIEKTEQEIKLDEIRRCAEYRRGAVESHISAYEVAFNDFWNNSEGVTAQEHCDALGSNAIQFFNASQATQNYILSIMPAWTPPTIPNEYVINPDGTITIGEVIINE